DTCGDVDDVFVDAKRQRVYVTCEDGYIDILNSSGDYERLDRIATRRGARTSLFMPTQNRLAVAARASEREPAELWIYRASPRGESYATERLSWRAQAMRTMTAAIGGGALAKGNRSPSLDLSPVRRHFTC